MESSTVAISKGGQLHSTANPGKLKYSSDEDIVAFVRTQKARQKISREKLERRWFLNIAYFVGHQYMQWDPYRKSLYLPSQPRHRIRIVVNRLMPMVRRAIASTVRQRPQWVVNPATNEIEDQITSLLAKDYLRYQWGQLSMDKKLVNLLMWRETCSDVFIRSYWDPFRGESFAMSMEDVADRIPRDEEDLEGIRRDTRKRLKKDKLIGPDDADTKTIFLGDVATEVVSPFNIFPDPEAENLEECEFLIDCRLRGPRYIEKRYGKKTSDLRPAGDEHGGLRKKRQLRDLSPTGIGGAITGDKTEEESLVDLDTIWVRPQKDEPNGWWATICGDKVLRKGRNKPGFPTFPWAHVQSINIPGKFWGTCPMEQAIPIQVAYNRARSQILEHVNTVSRPPWLVPKTSSVNRTSFTGEPGEVIQYVWPMKPELAQLRDIPMSAQHNVGQTIEDMEDVTSQHEASRGIAPGRVESGVGVAQLQESDDSVLAPMNTVLADALSEIGTQVLQIASQNVTEDRLVRIFGEDEVINVRNFQGKDLLGNNSGKAGVSYFDVRVEMGVNLPLSPGERRRFATELAQFGILNPEIREQREKLLEILELNREPGNVSEGQRDKANQRRENEIMTTTGEPPEIWPFDNDELHISTAREYQKSPEYMEVINQSGGAESPIHQAFEAHIKSHTDRLTQRAMVSAGQSGPLGPTGPAPEGPGGGGGGPGMGAGPAPPGSLPTGPPGPPGQQMGTSEMEAF